jgi:uncharacterized Zn-binding protein involved in type VI secretion
MAKPAARLTDPTTCPLPGHGVNPIASGSPDVLFDGLPAAREGDPSACGSPLVAGLSTTVFINGLQAATIGSVGAHGNVIIGGSGTVIIGDSHTPAPFIPLAPIHFQKAYAQQFLISDSESGLPLANRDYVAVIDGVEKHGVTDAGGIVHIETPYDGAMISLHVKFQSPKRVLNEFTDEPK